MPSRYRPKSPELDAPGWRLNSFAELAKKVRGPLFLGMALMVLTGGCGGDGGPTQSGREEAKVENCIILANGTKLCGEDAKAYCKRFRPDPSDVQSEQACISVGGGRQPTQEDAEEQRTEDAAAAARAIQPEAKRILGSKYVGVVTAAGNLILVQTSYGRGNAPESVLRAVCNVASPETSLPVAVRDQADQDLRICPRS